MPDESIDQSELFQRLDKIVDLLEEIRDSVKSVDETVTSIEQASSSDTDDTDAQILEAILAINTTVGNQAGGGADP